MQWWETILAALGGIGGIIGLIVVAVKWFGGQMAERFQKNYEIRRASCRERV